MVKEFKPDPDQPVAPATGTSKVHPQYIWDLIKNKPDRKYKKNPTGLVKTAREKKIAKAKAQKKWRKKAKTKAAKRDRTEKKARGLMIGAIPAKGVKGNSLSAQLHRAKDEIA